MEVTCHKVFDVTPDGFQSLEDLIAAGCKRILTSGLQKTAVDGASMLSQLVAVAAGRITIMPGGSVRSSNITQLVQETGAKEFHSSGLTGQSQLYVADQDEVREMAGKLKH
jgi:copper homeostasis protein